MEAESNTQPHNQLDDAGCRLDAVGKTPPFAKHERDYIRHLSKKAVIIRAGSA
jgi:hypothetical protein